MGTIACRPSADPVTLTSSWNDFEIIAHRGDSAHAPENTIAAVKLAWQVGSDAVEVDVHLSHDQKIMAIHDPSTRRTAGQPCRVSQTPSARLRQLDVGRYKGEHFAGQCIPFLTDVLSCLPPQGRLFIDIKCGSEIISPLRDVLYRSGKQGQVVVISFDFEMLEQFKRAMPEVPAYGLCDTWLGRTYRQSLIRRAQTSGLDGLDLHWAGLTHHFAHQVRQAGLDLYVWTVDSPSMAQRLADMNVQGITTNNPGLYRSQRASLEDSPILYSQEFVGTDPSILVQAEPVGL